MGVFDISSFKTKFQFDGARPNLFKVRISSIDIDMPFFVKASSLPGSTIATVPVYYMGREVKVAGNRTFPEWNVTILNDEDFKIRNLLEGWMGQINSHENNVASALFTDYKMDATVTQMGKQGDELKTYKFVDMFPTDISPIELDWGTNDTVEEYQVTFAYQHWTSDQSSVG